MMTNKKKTYLYGAFALILTFIFFVLLTLPASSKKNTCKANIIYTISISKYKFTFNGNVLLNMKGNNEGYVFLSGFVNDDDGDYYLSQHIAINYLKTSPKEYQFSIKRIDQIKFDNIPDYLVTSLHDTMGLSGKTPVYFYTENKNYILWGTLISPVMNCVVLL